MRRKTKQNIKRQLENNAKFDVFTTTETHTHSFNHIIIEEKAIQKRNEEAAFIDTITEKSRMKNGAHNMPNVNLKIQLNRRIQF